MNHRRLTLGAGAIALAVSLLGSGCAGLEPTTRQMTWTSATHPKSWDAATGKFTRQGIARFDNGDVAVQTVDGQFTSRDGTTFDATVSYKFEDGSSFTHRGTGTRDVKTPKVPSVGAGTITGGTGRFAGITGKTTSVSRTLTDTDQYGEFKAEYSLPRR